MALALLKGQPDIAVTALAVPAEIPDVLDILEVHRQSLKAVGDLNGHRLAVETPALLEVGELGHFHAIQPHLPTHTPSAKGGGLPVVFDKTDVVIRSSNAQRFKRREVGLLNTVR